VPRSITTIIPITITITIDINITVTVTTVTTSQQHLYSTLVTPHNSKSRLSLYSEIQNDAQQQGGRSALTLPLGGESSYSASP
jgi:hypothetical protein